MELSFFFLCQPSGLGPRRSQQTQRKEPRKIIATVSLNEDVKLNKAEKAWKPSSKRASEEEDPENIKTQVGVGGRRVVHLVPPEEGRET